MVGKPVGLSSLRGTIMLLRGLFWLVLCQLIGTAINALFLPVLPGPILGLSLIHI